MFVALYNFIKQDLILVFSVHPQSWSTYFFFILCMPSGILNWNSISTLPRRTFKPHSFDNSSIFSMWVELSKPTYGQLPFCSMEDTLQQECCYTEKLSFSWNGKHRIKVANQDEVLLFMQLLQWQNYKSCNVEGLVHYAFGEVC